MLVNQIKRLYRKGFGTLASLFVTVTLVKQADPVYDSASGTVSTNEQTYPVAGFFRGLKDTELDERNIVAFERIFVTNEDRLHGLSIDPEKDYIIYEGVKYNIVSPVKRDPSNFIISIKLRRLE